MTVTLGVVLLRAGDTAPPPETGSTLDSTWIDRDGDGTLERGPGEPLRDRTDLGPAGRPGRTLATFAQISDAHIRDEESPGRLPVLDRFGPPFVSAFRPQEALTPQVLAGTVAALNRLRPQAVAVTGDLVDSAQANELEQASAVLRGGEVDPDSGRRGYDGPQAASNPDPFFYRPGVDAPRRPRLVEDAQRRFRSPGLDAPWFPAAGNHDVLTAGVVAPSERIAAAATGSQRIAELDEGLEVPRSSESISPELVDRVLGEGLGRSVQTPSDRRATAPRHVARRSRACAGPAAPGARDRGSTTPSTSATGVRALVLDGARRDSGSGGLIGPESLAFLRRELARPGERRLVVFSHHPLRRSEGGEAALALLEADPRVVAAVSGHAHRNSVSAQPDPPRLARAVAGRDRLARRLSPAGARLPPARGAPRGLVLETWMIDHTGGRLAQISRELSNLDAQGGRPAGSRGLARDRNVRLHIPRSRGGAVKR